MALEFGSKVMKMYGWCEGSGLGKDGSGILQPVIPKLKFDNRGVGYSYKSDEGFAWWEHSYNLAAGNLNVHQIGGRKIKLSTNDRQQESKKVQHQVCESKKKFCYTSFSQGGTLKNDGTIVKSKSDGEVKEVKSIHHISDEELFKICGGRTAHKGARLGIRSSGKLLRLQKQEESTELNPSPLECGKKRKRKNYQH